MNDVIWNLGATFVGVLATVIVGRLLVPVLLDCVEASMVRPWGGTIPKPTWIASQDLWNEAWRRGGGGGYIGVFEQIIFFAAFWSDVWPIFAAWLAFKVACQWESWKHSDGFIDRAKKESPAIPEDLLAIQRWVSVRYVSFLVGTSASVVIALGAATVGKVILRFLTPGLEV